MAEKNRIEIEITEDNREAFKKATREQIDVVLKTVGAEIERNDSNKIHIEYEKNLYEQNKGVVKHEL